MLYWAHLEEGSRLHVLPEPFYTHTSTRKLATDC